MTGIKLARSLRSWKCTVRRLLTRAVNSSNVPADPQLPFLAPEVLAHLAGQRGAQDTIEGIQWGVLHACTRNWVPKIAKTVKQLVEQGFLEEKRSSDGKIFYYISPRYLSNLQQPPPKNSTPDATQ